MRVGADKSSTLVRTEMPPTKRKTHNTERKSCGVRMAESTEYLTAKLAVLAQNFKALRQLHDETAKHHELVKKTSQNIIGLHDFYFHSKARKLPIEVDNKVYASDWISSSLKNFCREIETCNNSRLASFRNSLELYSSVQATIVGLALQTERAQISLAQLLDKQRDNKLERLEEADLLRGRLQLEKTSKEELAREEARLEKEAKEQTILFQCLEAAKGELVSSLASRQQSQQEEEVEITRSQKLVRELTHLNEFIEEKSHEFISQTERSYFKRLSREENSIIKKLHLGRLGESAHEEWSLCSVRTLSTARCKEDCPIKFSVE